MDHILPIAALWGSPDKMRDDDFLGAACAFKSPGREQGGLAINKLIRSG